METYYDKAEKLIQETITELEKLISRKDGEDISYYKHSILNRPIQKLIDAKALMAVVNGFEI